MNLKITILIFLFAAILITLFPPYNWGEERLQTEAERYKTVEWGLAQKPAIYVLPLKQRAFLFGETKQQFKIQDPSPNINYESTITLDRKLIIEDFILEYLLAALLAALAGWLVPNIDNSTSKERL